MDSTPPSTNTAVQTLPIAIAVSCGYPNASALAWNRRGSSTSDPNTSWAVKPCRISHRFVRRATIAGRSRWLIRYSYSSPAANTPASWGSLSPRRMS